MNSAYKVCIRCGERKPLSEFYAHNQMVDGHLGKCKECCKAAAVANRLANYDRYLGYDMARGRIRNGEKVSSNQYRTAAGMAAHSATARAVKKGALVRLPCEVCGNLDSHAHHDDYSKPLEVRWLCHTHHMELHRKSGPHDD